MKDARGGGLLYQSEESFHGNAGEPAEKNKRIECAGEVHSEHEYQM